MPRICISIGKMSELLRRRATPKKTPSRKISSMAAGAAKWSAAKKAAVTGLLALAVAFLRLAAA